MCQHHFPTLLKPLLPVFTSTDIRDRVNKGGSGLTTDGLLALLAELDARIVANGWDTPRPKATPRQLLRQAAEANKQVRRAAAHRTVVVTLCQGRMSGA